MAFTFHPADTLSTIHWQWLHYHSKRSERLAKSPSTSILDGMATDFQSPVLHDFEHLAMNRWGSKGPWVTEPRKYHEAVSDSFGNVARFKATHHRYPSFDEFIPLFQQGEYPTFHTQHPNTLQHHYAWVLKQHRQLIKSPAYRALPIVTNYRDYNVADAYRAFMEAHSFQSLFPPPPTLRNSVPKRLHILG